MHDFLGRRLRTTAVALVTAATAACVATPAQAKPSRQCDSSPVSQPFAQFGDTSSYELVAGSDFTDASGWTLGGGAHLVAGGEPFAVTGAVSPESLDLPAGAWTQSPFTCVDASDPTFRVFAENVSSSAENVSSSAALVASVVYATPGGVQLAVPVGTITPTGGWAPSPVMITASQAVSLLGGGTAQVALRFTAVSGEAAIDDVFIDPRMSD
jgi:hypothetical protein